MERVPLNIVGALAEGEITTDEFVVLAWLERVGEWHGTTTQLHAALRWPHTVKHLRDDVLRRLRDASLVHCTMQDRSRLPYSLAPVAVVAVASRLEQSDCGAPASPSGGRTVLHSSKGTVSSAHVNGNAIAHCTPTGTHGVQGARGSGREGWKAEWRASSGDTREAGPEWSALAQELDARLP